MMLLLLFRNLHQRLKVLLGVKLLTLIRGTAESYAVSPIRQQKSLPALIFKSVENGDIGLEPAFSTGSFVKLHNLIFPNLLKFIFLNRFIATSHIFLYQFLAHSQDGLGILCRFLGPTSDGRFVAVEAHSVIALEARLGV